MSEDRRDFLKQSMTAFAGVAAMPLAAASVSTQKVVLAKPITVKVLENNDTTDGDRSETTSKFELIGNNGSFHRVSAYSLKIERSDSYDITSILKTDRFLSVNDASPADSDVQVIIVSGDKGTVEGTYRNDEVQTTIIGPNGIVKSPPQLIKKNLVDSYEGLTAEAKAQAALNARIKSAK